MTLNKIITKLFLLYCFTFLFAVVTSENPKEAQKENLKWISGASQMFFQITCGRRRTVVHIPTNSVVCKFNRPFKFSASVNEKNIALLFRDKVIVMKHDDTWKIVANENIQAKRLVVLNNGSVVLHNDTTVANLQCEYSTVVTSDRAEKFIVANPEYNMTDGIVYVYEKQLVQTIPAPVSASYFGCQIEQRDSMLFVSAPFANRGAGCFYIYVCAPVEYKLQQTIFGESPVEQLGKMFHVSPNNRFILIHARCESKSKTTNALFLFEFSSEKNAYVFLARKGCSPDEKLTHMYVDNVGTCVYSTRSDISKCE